MKIVLGAAFAAVLLAGAMGLAGVTPASALTNKECNDQWHSDPQGKAAGVKFRDYKANTCANAADTTAAPAAPAAAPAPMAPAPAAAPAVAKPAPMAPAPMAPAPAAKGAMGANEFSTESEAKGHCPSDTVVWANSKSKSKSWHYAGTKYYGKTKAGAYMCQADATAAGFHAAKNELAPK